MTDFERIFREEEAFEVAITRWPIAGISSESKGTDHLAYRIPTHARRT